MIKKISDKTLLASTGIVFLAIFLFVSLQKHPNYHKTSRFEHLAHTLFYSTVNHLALAGSFRGEASFSLSMPYFRQENGLTCEVAALRTVLSYRGTNVSEAELLDKLAFDTREPMSSNGTWGDPENGFIGSVNGSIFNRTGFGVYEKPILNLALEYYNAAILEDADLTEVLNEVLSGNPVIVWGLLSRRASVSWQTKDGKVVSVRPGEHARVVIGFTGDPLNPKEIILMDPIYGRIRMGKNKFISDWEIMDNRAVVVYKDMTISNQI